LSKYCKGFNGPGVFEKQIVNLFEISMIDLRIATLGKSNTLQ